MSRKWKYVMLAAAGGVMLQMAGCGQMLVETLVSNIIPLVLSQVLAGALGSGTTT